MDENEKSEMMNRIWDACVSAGFMEMMYKLTTASGYLGSQALTAMQSDGLLPGPIVSGNQKDIACAEGNFSIYLPFGENTPYYLSSDDDIVDGARTLAYLKGYNANDRNTAGSYGVRFLNSLAIAKKYDSYVKANGTGDGFSAKACGLDPSDAEGP